jgi:hypothetical protein
MNILIRQRSASFLLIGWCLVAALFADGINLDDLLPGRFVIHDQDDAVQASLVPLAAQSTSDAGPGSSGAPRVGSKPSETQSLKFLRFVFDEDSPSEPAGPLVSVIVPFTPVAENQAASLSTSTSSSLLHLLHCALLI